MMMWDAGGVGMNEVQNTDHWVWSGLVTRGAFANTEYSGCGVDYESKDKLDVPQEKKLS